MVPDGLRVVTLGGHVGQLVNALHAPIFVLIFVLREVGVIVFSPRVAASLAV